MLVKDARIAAIMSAYNRVRGVCATENRDLLTTVLRDEWGFDEYVQSDFWSARSCVGSLNAGLDHEMPDAKWLNEAIVKAALQDTSLEIQTVDRALVRRFTQMFRFGQFRTPLQPGRDRRRGRRRDLPPDRRAARRPTQERGRAAAPGCSVGGTGAHRWAVRVRRRRLPGGGGSLKVIPLYTVTPADGMRDVLALMGPVRLSTRSPSPTTCRTWTPPGPRSGRPRPTG
jgi:beta-glucosidase